MNKTRWLGTAAAVAAVGVIVYTQFSASDPPLPKVALSAETAADVPQLALPPVVLPPEESLAIAADVPPTTAGSDVVPPPITLVSATEPTASPVPPAPTPPVPTVPMIPTAEPAVPGVPAMPLLPPASVDPTLPAPLPAVETPPAPVKPESPVPVAPPITPVRPEVPLPITPITPVPAAPIMPLAPVPAPPLVPVPATPPITLLPAASIPAMPTTPSLPPAVSTPPAGAPAPLLPPPVSAKPEGVPVPPNAGEKPREGLAVAGRYIVLKDNKLVEGGVMLDGDTVVVRQGSIDRKFPKAQVQFVAATKDEVYRFMVAKVSASDAAGRLQVARWCMFSGMREQALAEAREVEKLRPSGVEGARAHNAAVDLARSLELSLQQFPPEGAAKMAAPATPTFPAELAPVRPVSPATPDAEPDVSPEAALVFGARVQPFLANQCTECHAKPDYDGKFKLVRVNPADAGPQATRTNLKAVAAQLRKDDPGASLLLWKTLTAHGGMKLPAVMNRQAVVYQTLEAWVALAVGTPLAVPAPAHVAAPPLVPVADAVTPPAPTLLPPPPPSTDAQLPLPVPPVIPSTPKLAPAAPPVIPPADAGSMPLPLPPAIPPAAAAPLPPTPVVPVGGTQFGAAVPPKLPVTGPTGADEFDATGFNQQRK